MAFQVSVHGEQINVATQEQAWAKIREICDQKGYDPNLKVSEVTDTPIVVSAPAQRALPVPSIVRGETVDVEGKARAEADAAAARAAGFAVAEPLYATGTMVNDMGVANARKFRAEWEAMPLIREALENLADKVRGERRADKVVNPRHVRMTSEGDLILPNDERIAIDEVAFRDLVSRAGLPSAGAYLAECEPDLRAYNVNKWFSGSQGALKADEIVLRTRVQNGARVVWAVVTGRYHRFDIDEMARTLADTVPADGRGNVFYDGRTMQMDAIWNSNVKPEKYVAGEVFRASLRARTNDAAGGCAEGSAMTHRNLCLNLIILDLAKQGLFKLRHIKGRRDFSYEVQRGIRRGSEALGYFIRKWDESRSDLLTQTGRVVNLEDASKPVPQESLTDLMWGVFLAQARRETVPVAQSHVREVLRAWQVEPEPTRAGVVNAYTRYAQSLDPFKADEVERAAGALLASKAPLHWSNPADR